MMMPGSLLDGCTDFVDDKLKSTIANPSDAKGNTAVTHLAGQMMKGRIGGGMAGSRKIGARDSLIWSWPGRRGRGFLFVEDQQNGYARDDKACRNQLGLSGVKAKDVVFAVHADLFNKKSLYPIKNEVDSKKFTGGPEPFAY